MSLPAYVREEELVERDGLFVRAGEPASRYRQRWDEEARADHVLSATGREANGHGAFAQLTTKVAPLWNRIPPGSELGDVLEVGSGYGRIPLYLGRERGLRWRSYCAVDISAEMLRRLVDYGERFVPDRPLTPICLSADRLPFRDDSFDLALSSAVFLHMGKPHVHAALREIARVLRPGAAFVFDVAFPNARNPASAVSRLKPRRLRTPHHLKFWSRGEVERAIVASGLAAKTGEFTVEPGSFALLPKTVGPLRVPLARAVNDALTPPPGRLRDVLGVTFNAYTTRLAA